jgi:4-hydroxy-4-methyl-2-oxoglutarate aldolase
MTIQEQSVVELQARWDKLRSANVYDVLDRMGYPNQCVDLGIRPLFPHRHLAGQVITVRGSAYPVARGEKGDEWVGDYFEKLRQLVYPGSVVVIDSGGETHAGKFGEMTSWALQQAGARGIVVDTYIRDWLGLEVIPNYTACARGTSPIESSQRWRIDAVNVTIGLPGTLTSRVRVQPGDWLVAEADGIIVIPQSIAPETLIKAEAMETSEQGMRDDIAKGMSFDDAFNKWGRA